MQYLTDRKRARGMGAARTGTEHFWRMKVSSVALLVLAPLFLLVVAPLVGAPRAAVTESLGKPFPALVVVLTLGVGFMHFKDGCRVLIEDYVHGAMQHVAVIAVTIVSYGAAAAGVFAVARMAL